MQTGIGRTGKMFAFQHADIEPDVLVLSKAIGGSLPLSVVVYDKALDQWEPGAHIGTFRGNQLAMATGKATLSFVKEHALDAHAHDLGIYMQMQLKAIQSNSFSIGDVRGRGLMIGVEIIDWSKPANKIGTHPGNGELAKVIQQECFKRGVILEVGGRHGAVIRLLPPLILSQAQADDVLERFKEAVKAAEAKWVTR